MKHLMTSQELDRLLEIADGYVIQKREGFLCVIPRGMASEVEPNCAAYPTGIAELIRAAPYLIWHTKDLRQRIDSALCMLAEGPEALDSTAEANRQAIKILLGDKP